MGTLPRYNFLQDTLFEVHYRNATNTDSNCNIFRQKFGDNLEYSIAETISQNYTISMPITSIIINQAV